MNSDDKICVSNHHYTKKQCLVTALDIDADNVTAWNHLGLSLDANESIRIKGIFYKQYDCFKRAISCSGQPAYVWNNLGTMLIAGISTKVAGTTVTAQSCFVRALETFDTFKDSLRKIGVYTDAVYWRNLGSCSWPARRINVCDTEVTQLECFAKATEILKTSIVPVRRQAWCENRQLVFRVIWGFGTEVYRCLSNNSFGELSTDKNATIGAIISRKGFPDDARFGMTLVAENKVLTFHYELTSVTSFNAIPFHGWVPAIDLHTLLLEETPVLVHKFGAGSGFTTAKVTRVQKMQNVSDETDEFLFTLEESETHFAADGDTGSVVFTVDGEGRNRPVGLLGAFQHDDKTCLVIAQATLEDNSWVNCTGRIPWQGRR